MKSFIIGLVLGLAALNVQAQDLETQLKQKYPDTYRLQSVTYDQVQYAFFYNFSYEDPLTHVVSYAEAKAGTVWHAAPSTFQDNVLNCRKRDTHGWLECGWIDDGKLHRWQMQVLSVTVWMPKTEGLTLAK